MSPSWRKKKTTYRQNAPNKNYPQNEELRNIEGQ